MFLDLENGKPIEQQPVTEKPGKFGVVPDVSEVKLTTPFTFPFS